MRALDDDDPVERIIRLAWADRVTFEEIEASTGLAEGDLIRFMRRHQTAKAFKRWRARVTGRMTKHRTRFREQRRTDQYPSDDLASDVDA